MKIGHYDSELWERGGVANYMRRVGAAQVTLGHEVVYFSLHPPKGRTLEFDPFLPVLNTVELFAQAEAMGLDILHVHKAVSAPQSSPVPLIRTLHGHHPYCPSGGRYLKRWQKPCDRAYHPLGCLWGYVVDRCGSVRPATLQDNFGHTAIEQRTLPHMPAIAVSHFVKDQMVRSGYPSDKIQVLHHFAPRLGSGDPPPSGDPPRFLYLGRVTQEKGMEWLLRAMAKVPSPIHLDIAGAGDYSDDLHHLAKSLGLQDRVRCHGWVEPQRIDDLMQQARAMVFPSVWPEPAGLVAFEAMASGRAVIASRVGGIPELVQDGVNGLLVDPWDVEALADGLQRLATQPELAKAMGQQGHQLVKERFTLDQHIDKLTAIYTSVGSLN